MKKAFLGVISLVIAACVFVSCVPDYPVLCEITEGDYVFRAYGDDEIRYIFVYDAGDKRVFSASVTGAATFADEQFENYGFTVCDLNFDGYPDMLLLTGIDLGILSYRAWLYDTEKGKFKKSDEISNLKNITVNTSDKNISGYSTEQVLASTEGVKPEVYNDIYKISFYKWENGEMLLDYYITLTHYGSENIWAYTKWVRYIDGEFTELFENWVFDDNLGEYDIRPR